MNLFPKKAYQFKSCMEGEIIKLENVNDPVFANKTMGEGFAYIPNVGKILAPFDGKVVMIFKTKHAIGLKDTSGLEFLIHIGLDTVKLEGKGFNILVKENEVIKEGQLIAEFDIELIESEGYSLESCIILTNLCKKFSLLTEGNVKLGQSNIFMIR